MGSACKTCTGHHLVQGSSLTWSFSQLPGLSSGVAPWCKTPWWEVVGLLGYHTGMTLSVCSGHCKSSECTGLLPPSNTPSYPTVFGPTVAWLSQKDWLRMRHTLSLSPSGASDATQLCKWPSVFSSRWLAGLPLVGAAPHWLSCVACRLITCSAKYRRLH